MFILDNEHSNLINLDRVNTIECFDNSIEAFTIDKCAFYLGEYSSKENVKRAFKDLCMQIEQKKDMIKVLTDEQVSKLRGTYYDNRN